jgi:hypothetical protein
MSERANFALTDRDIELAAITCTRALQFIRMTLQGDVPTDLTPAQLRKLAQDTATLYVKFHNEAVARGMGETGSEMRTDAVSLRKR